MTAGAALMRRRSPPDDQSVMWLIFLAVGVLVGLVVGRAWALAAVIPFAVWMAQTDGLEGNLELVVAVGGSVFIAAGILAGVLARRLMPRRTGST